MDAAVPQDLNYFPCTQCGGELHPDEGQIFITCPYCSSTVYLDKSQAVFHWYLASTIDEEKARSNLHRWMSGNQTVKDLDAKAKLTKLSFEYFPVWFFKSRDKNNNEQIWLEPAAATSVSEIKSLRLPAGDLRKYDPDLDSEARSPDIPHKTVTGWLKNRLPRGATIIETSLVHIPLYTAKYIYKKNTYTAVIESATGGVAANIYPEKFEAPYVLAGGITAIVYLFLATFPVIGALVDSDGSGFLIGLAAYVGIGLIAAPLLFALAYWVAAKV
jgi:hypothetical protein